MRRPFSVFLLIFGVAITPRGNALLFTCLDIPLEGTKSLQIDRAYLFKTRIFQDIPDSEEIHISKFFTSKTTEISFARIEGSPDFFTVTTNNHPEQLAYLLAWVSNRERDGTCAIELQGYSNGDVTREFLQILAIYPEGTLAVGLPNKTDRQGLILLATDEGI